MSNSSSSGEGTPVTDGPPGFEGGGTTVSFINGEIVTNSFKKLECGPLFDHLLLLNGNEPIDIEKIKDYIEKSVTDYKHPFYNEQTALFIVAQSSTLGNDVLDLLLDGGYNIEATDARQLTPLLHGLRCRATENVKHLIRRGANVHAATPDGNAITYAVSGGDQALIEVLMKKGVDLNYISGSGDIPLNAAILRRNIDLIDYLLKQQHQPLILNSTPERPLLKPPLCAAAFEGDIDVVSLLIDAGADVNGYGEQKLTPLMIALWHRNVPLSLVLLEKGAKPSLDLEADEMYIACKNKVPAVILPLIEKGARLDKLYDRRKRSLIHAALSFPQIYNEDRNQTYEQEIAEEQAYEQALQSTPEVVKILSSTQVDFNSPDQDNVIPLVMAQSLEVFQLLKSNGARLDVKVQGNNLLHLLMENPIVSIMEYVLGENVINVNEQNQDGLTPLHVASMKKKKQDDPYAPPEDLGPIVRLLLNHNAQVNALSPNGQSPLFFALSNKNYESAKILIQSSADLTTKDKTGNTVLHVACSIEGDAEKILTLLTKNAPVEQLHEWLSTKNAAGETPAILARKFNNEGIALFLEENIIGAAMKGVSVFDLAKLNPQAVEKMEKGYVLEPTDTSKYNLSTSQTSLVFRFPKELITDILFYVDVKDLLSFSLVCRQFKLWSDISDVWKNLFRRVFGHDLRDDPKSEFAIKWHTNVNMKKGVFYTKTILIDPNLDVALENGGYGHPAHNGVTSMDCDPSSNLLIVGDTNSHLAFIDLKKAVLKKVVTKTVNQMDFESCKLEDIFVCPQEKTVFYRHGSGPLMASNYETEDKDIRIADQCISFSVDGEFILSANYTEYRLQKWKTKELVWSNSVGGSAYMVALSRHTAVTATGANGDTRVRFWHPSSNSLLSQSQPQEYATYLWESENYVVGSASHLLECFEIHSGNSLWRVKNAHTGLLIDNVRIDETSNTITSVSGAELFVWDLLSGKQIARLNEQDPRGRNGWHSNQKQYLSMTTKDDLVFGGVTHQNSHMIEVFDVRKATDGPIYQIPLRASPKSLLVIDNLLCAGLTNATVVIVNFQL